MSMRLSLLGDLQLFADLLSQACEDAYPDVFDFRDMRSGPIAAFSVRNFVDHHFQRSFEVIEKA